jgi:AcrR family transcriptional regulator
MTSASALRERHKSETRQLILAAARRVFIREGHARFTMREVAHSLACSPGAIYLYFGGKEELLHCLVEESFSKLLDVLNDVPTGEDPTANLKARLRAYVNFGLMYPFHYHFAFLLPPTVERPKGGLPLTPHEAFEVLRRSVAECRWRGLMPSVDGETASQALWAAVHGITSLLIAKPEFPWVERERLIAQVIDMAVDGLLSGAKASEGKRRVARDRKGGRTAAQGRHGAR